MMAIWTWRAAADAETRTPSARSSTASDRSCTPSAGVAASRGPTATTWRSRSCWTRFVRCRAIRERPAFHPDLLPVVAARGRSLSLFAAARRGVRLAGGRYVSAFAGDIERTGSRRASRQGRGGRAAEASGLAPGGARTLRRPGLLFGRDVRDGDFSRAEQAGGDRQDSAPSGTSGAAQGVDGPLNCEAFLDLPVPTHDVRAAGRGLGNLPPDMAAHMLVCDECRAAYHAARADDLLLTRALRDVPSPAWRAEVLRQMARVPRTSWSQRIATVNEVVIWGILAVAAWRRLLLGQELDRRVRRRLLGRWCSGSAGSESGKALAGASSPTAVGVVSGLEGLTGGHWGEHEGIVLVAPCTT